ncbi:MAG: exosortase/archaeosortase family protein [Planctomycetaceae bacterium]|nr:exosortase/archaeosortase family protein [Planctomycetaceae bacterium]
MTQISDPTPEGAAGASLADLVEDASVEASSAGRALPAGAWVKFLLLTAILAAINIKQFPELFYSWLTDANWSHGFIIPLFSIFLLYSRWREILAAPRKVCLWGLPALLAASLIALAGYNYANPWTVRTGMLLMGCALVWYVAGTTMLRLTWLPILFLFFAMPIPNAYYGNVALHLQNIAAAASATVLQWVGVDIVANQSNLTVTSLTGASYPLTVAEACSGMRLLMAFVALGVAMAYLTDRPLWQRVVLVLAAVPIAIASNIIRVVITCLMHVIDKPEMGKGFMHDFTGMLMLIPAMLMLWGLGWLLRHLFVEEPEETEEAQDEPQEGTP